MTLSDLGKRLERLAYMSPVLLIPAFATLLLAVGIAENPSNREARFAEVVKLELEKASLSLNSSRTVDASSQARRDSTKALLDVTVSLQRTYQSVGGKHEGVKKEIEALRKKVSDDQLETSYYSVEVGKLIRLAATKTNLPPATRDKFIAAVDTNRDASEIVRSLDAIVKARNGVSLATLGLDVPRTIVWQIGTSYITAPVETVCATASISLIFVVLIWQSAFYRTRAVEILLTKTVRNPSALFPHLLNVYPLISSRFRIRGRSEAAAFRAYRILVTLRRTIVSLLLTVPLVATVLSANFILAIQPRDGPRLFWLALIALVGMILVWQAIAIIILEVGDTALNVRFVVNKSTDD